MAQFRITEAFALESRGLFILTGDVVTGRIIPGMQVEIPLNTGTLMTAPIYAVEYVRRSSSHEEIGLCIKCENGDELQTWKGLNIGSEVVEVS
jgi:hypothetical protein